MSTRSEKLKSMEPDLIADVWLYSENNGGRKAPALPGYSCPCMVSNEPPFIGWDASFQLGDDPIYPGDRRRIGLVFLTREGAVHILQAGHFYLWERGIIGEANVVGEVPEANQ